MNITMISNTYLPHVGGVAQSIKRFAEAYRAEGHDVLIVAPEFPDSPPQEEDVLRIPAIQNFNGSDFSVSLPLPSHLYARLKEFGPDIIHSHHPFLTGDTALRVAALHSLPLVYTHHTLYEHYTHYVPIEAAGIKELVIELQTGYASLADQVVAPSEGVRNLIRERGVETPIAVIPTGVDIKRFESGDRGRGRRRLAVAEDSCLIGHVGRLAEEKNPTFLAESICRALQVEPRACALIVGDGPAEECIRKIFAAAGLQDRLIMPGALSGEELVDAYQAMDIFAFASRTETQGMVLAEAMASGTPVVALDAFGSRDVIVDKLNGRLVMEENHDAFAGALQWCCNLDKGDLERMGGECRARARQFATPRCAGRMLDLYERTIARRQPGADRSESKWECLLLRLEEEWRIWKNRGGAIKTALSEG